MDPFTQLKTRGIQYKLTKYFRLTVNCLEGYLGFWLATHIFKLSHYSIPYFWISWTTGQNVGNVFCRFIRYIAAPAVRGTPWLVRFHLVSVKIARQHFKMNSTFLYFSSSYYVCQGWVAATSQPSEWHIQVVHSAITTCHSSQLILIISTYLCQNIFFELRFWRCVIFQIFKRVAQSLFST